MSRSKYFNFRPENVAEAIVKMIKQADPGAVWVSEDNKPPFAIQDLPFYKERSIAEKK